MAIIELKNCTNPTFYRGSTGFKQYLVVILALFVFVFGLIFNLLILFLIVKFKSLKTIPNLFIANLASADILYLFGHVLIDVPRLFWSTFLGGSVICKLQACTKYATLGGSVFTLTVMAIDRFTAIVLPLSHQSSYWRSKKFVLIVIISIWLVSIMISLPIVSETNILEKTLQVNKSCVQLNVCFYREGFTSNKAKALLWTKFAIHFLLPFSIMSVCYLIIALKLESQGGSEVVQANITSRSINRRRKSSKIVIGFIVTFLLCRLPEQIHSIVVYSSKYSNYYAMVLTQVIAYFYPFLNPLSLLLISAQFRFLLLKLFHCKDYDISMNTASYVAKSKVYYNSASKKRDSILNSGVTLNIEDKKI